MRRAEAADTDRVLAILEDGKRQIAGLGIDQWQGGYPDRAAVEQDIDAGTCWIAEDAAGAAVGTLALVFDADASYEQARVPWLTASGAGTPAYAAIHRCATASRALGRGVMGSMFEQAAAIARAAGRSGIRIDTHPGNRAMRGFIAKQGYTEVGVIELEPRAGAEGSRTRIAYEKLI